MVVATHLDTNHLHNHLIVNSVSCETSWKLHQSADDLLRHLQANEEICAAHGLNVLKQPEKRSKKKRMKPGEYQAGLRDDSWKMDLIHNTSRSFVPTDGRAETAVCTTRLFSKNTWKPCSFTGRLLVFVLTVWSRTRAGWRSAFSVDAEARLQDDLSLASFIAGFRLACEIAHELGLKPPYSFRQEEEEQIGK